MKIKKSITKRSILLNAVWSAAIICICLTMLESCTTSSPPPPPDSTDCDEVCMNYSSSTLTTTISGDLALTMAHDYQATRPTINNGLYNGPDAASVWFTLEDLKKFIWQIESRTCSSPCVDSLNLGIRIYYARYPEISSDENRQDLRGVPRNYGRMHTLFMVPTFDDPRDGPNPDNHYDFYLDQAFNECLPVRIVNDTAPIGPITAFMPGRTKNHGTLCPPVCGNAGIAFGQ